MKEKKVFVVLWVAMFAASAMVAGAQSGKESQSLDVSNPELVTQFYKAVTSGDLAKVKAMVGANPALVNVKPSPDRGGRMPLHEAAFSNRKSVVEFLLSRGADVNGLSAHDTPLHYTVTADGDRSDMVEFLLSHGANINGENDLSEPTTPLIRAAVWGTPVSTVRLLLDRGASINRATNKGRTALHAACSTGRVEIVELLLSRGADTSALDDQKRTPLAIAEEQARKLPNQPKYQTVVDILQGRRPKPQDTKFTYTGRALIDDRKAELEFTIEGGEVTGTLKIYGVKSPNARLAGADLDFRVSIDGPWEDAKTQIQGRWSGVDHLEPDAPNDGDIFIGLLKPGNLFAEEVYVKLIGRRGQYGWCFPASGRVYKGSANVYEESVGENPLRGPTKDRVVTYAQENPFLKWATARKQLSANYTLPKTEESFFENVLFMAVGEKKTITMEGRPAATDPGTGELKPIPGKIVSQDDVLFYYEPASVIRTSNANKAGVNIEAVAKGIGKVILQRGVDIEMPNGNIEHRSGALIFVIEVQEKEGPPTVPMDIPRVDLCGRAVRRGDRTPVAGARISLVIASGSNKGKSYMVENNTTNNEGKFCITGRNLATGDYEILVQLLGTKGIANENDLWPVKKYVLKLTYDLAKEGFIDTGIFEMERVEYLDFANRPDQIVAPTVGATVTNSPRKK